MSAVLERHRFNVDEYYRMADIGVLGWDSPVELIEGEVFWRALGCPKDYSADEYERLIAAAILGRKDKVELIEGSIVEMFPTGMEHVGVAARLLEKFTRSLGDRALVGAQTPIRVSERSQPEPDVAVLRRRDYYYTGHRPQPSDVLWLVEVSDSSLAFDRGDKLRLYALNGIPEIWIVNLPQRQLELYADPDGDSYRSQRVIVPGESFSGTAMPDQQRTMAELLELMQIQSAATDTA